MFFIDADLKSKTQNGRIHGYLSEVSINVQLKQLKCLYMPEIRMNDNLDPSFPDSVHSNLLCQFVSLTVSPFLRNLETADYFCLKFCIKLGGQ